MTGLQTAGIVALCAFYAALNVSADSTLEKRDPDAQITAAYQASLVEGGDEEQAVAQIRYQIAQLRRDLEQKNRLLIRAQREAELKDPIAKGLRAELVELEKAAVVTRKSLQVRLDAMEEIRAIAAQQRELMAQVKELRNEERALLAGQVPTSAEPGQPTTPNGS